MGGEHNQINKKLYVVICVVITLKEDWKKVLCKMIDKVKATKKLIQLSEGNLLAQEKIVMQSIDEGWTGLHELKKTKAQIKKETVQSFQSLHDNLSF